MTDFIRRQSLNGGLIRSPIVNFSAIDNGAGELIVLPLETAAPSSGSGVASVTGAAEGQGYRLSYGSGTSAVTGEAVGRGYSLHYGSGTATAVGSASGEGAAVGGGPVDAVVSVRGGGGASARRRPLDELWDAQLREAQRREVEARAQPEKPLAPVAPKPEPVPEAPPAVDPQQTLQRLNAEVSQAARSVPLPVPARVVLPLAPVVPAVDPAEVTALVAAEVQKAADEDEFVFVLAEMLLAA